MTSSVVVATGKSLGRRHNSPNNLVASSDNVSEWLHQSSHDNTPKAQTGFATSHETIHRQDSFASLTDGFDIVSPPALSWSNTTESKIMGLNNADDYLCDLVEHSNDLKTTVTETLHVDDFFNDSTSASSSPYTGTTINLPGWNHGSEIASGFNSDADSPEGIWYGHTQAINSKTARRGPNVPSFAFNIEHSEPAASPGAPTSVEFDTLNSPSSTLPNESQGLLGAPARTLRSCISAPLLQRDDPVLEAAGTQNLINDYLIDVGFPQDRIPETDALGLELGPQSSVVNSPAQDGLINDVSLNTGSDGLHIQTELAGGNTSVAQSSALFQRRAVQRELHTPAPVAVPAAVEGSTGDQTIKLAPGRTVTVNNPAESTLDPEKMTDEQKRRLVQLHQTHVAQQAARLGVYQDFVTPSQQFAGQEASERAAKAVQAALMYGMEGNSPRKLSIGSTVLPTPVTPQHPLQPGPSSGGAGNAYHPHLQYMPDMQMQGYPVGANFDPRMLGMPLSADSASFAPSIQSQFSNLHLAQQQQAQAQQGQGVFTPQFLHQNNTTLFAGQGMGTQDMSGYTSVYPPPRHNSVSGGSGVDRGSISGASGAARMGMYGLTLSASGMVGGTTGVDQMLLAVRRGSHAVLRTSEPSPSLASQIAANPMQLQNPFLQQLPQQQQVPTTLEPAKLMGAAGSNVSLEIGLMPPVASTPRSAPADASREHLALQQTRMRQLQQQRPQLLQMQNVAVKRQQAAVSAAAQQGTVTTRKMPSNLSAPLSSPMSPAKMKSTPHLYSPLAGSSGIGLPPSPGKPMLRKIASNRRITTSGDSGSTLMASGSSGSSSASFSTSGHGLKSKSSNIGSQGFTLELTTTASPNRARTISHQSASSSRSHSSLSKSKSPTPSALASGSGNGGFSSLSFVNYGMDDADEICSAVTPSGSYKVPLRGFGASSGEDDDFDDEASSIRTRTMSNITGTTAGMMGSDEEKDSPGSSTTVMPGSPTKKVRKNSSRPNLLMASGSSGGSSLKSMRSVANLGGSSRGWDLMGMGRSPRKAKSTILSPVSSAGSGE
ncbi:hypothetical protein NDA13_000821 [Ustilago tritici]|nr:hypothetical protein NDA13_000821 [Ustilago tritici]